MRPERILADVRAALPRDALITTDVGWNKNGVGQQFPILEPGTIFTPGGYATMGFGAPAALGAKIAKPDRVVVALVGDGGFGQNPAMLATAFEEDVAVVWVIMNNYRVRHDRRPREGAFRNDVRHRVREERQAVFAGLRGHREGVWRRWRQDQRRRRVQAGARAARSSPSKPFVIDVVMQNEPVPTAGHWNIMDIYSPGKKVHHVSTHGAVHAD